MDFSLHQRHKLFRGRLTRGEIYPVHGDETIIVITVITFKTSSQWLGRWFVVFLMGDDDNRECLQCMKQPHWWESLTRKQVGMSVWDSNTNLTLVTMLTEQVPQTLTVRYVRQVFTPNNFSMFFVCCKQCDKLLVQNGTKLRIGLPTHVLRECEALSRSETLPVYQVRPVFPDCLSSLTVMLVDIVVCDSPVEVPIIGCIRHNCLINYLVTHWEELENVYCMEQNCDFIRQIFLNCPIFDRMNSAARLISKHPIQLLMWVFIRELGTSVFPTANKINSK